MSTKTKQIAGLAFSISAPYVAGHAITEAEARALNQVRSENIGNNLRETIKKAVEEGKSEAEIVAAVAKYDSEYVFNMASATATAKYTPEEREARKIAKEQVSIMLANKGLSFKKFPEGYDETTWAEKLEGNIDRISTDPAVMKKAAKAVADRAKAKSEIQDSLDI